MRSTILALALTGMLTVEQGDPRRTHLDPPSAALSEDARFLAFTTFARLAPADLDEHGDVYVLDRVDERVTLESDTLDAGVFSYGAPALSGDGRFLIYEDRQRIVLKDRVNGSARVLGVGRQPAMSSDGRKAVFTSDALRDICVADVENGGTTCVGRQAIGGVNPSISGDGRHIAFSSSGSVFVHDSRADTIERIGAGWNPVISGDGEWIAFVSAVRSLPTVFLTERHTGKSQLVSRSRTGGRANGHSASPAISRDGRVVAFQSEASNLVDDEDFNLLWDVFLFHRETGKTSRVSGDLDAGWMEPSGGPALNAGGDVVAFSSRHPTDAADKNNDFDLFVATVERRH